MSELPPRNDEHHETITEDELLELRAKYIRGCVKIISRGDRLPDRVMTIVGNALNFPEPPSDTPTGT